MKADEEIIKCKGCGKIIDDEEFITSYEDRGEFWGAPCSELITIGYKCKCCGAQEDF